MHFKSHLAITAVLSLTTTSQSFSQQVKKVEVKDFGKRRIERRLEKSVLSGKIRERQKAKSETKIPPRGISIFGTERPTRRIIRKNSSPQASHKNPKVKPGDVLWYSQFEQALAASQQTGKPVLLFFMVGKLDKRFS